VLLGLESRAGCIFSLFLNAFEWCLRFKILNWVLNGKLSVSLGRTIFRDKKSNYAPVLTISQNITAQLEDIVGFVYHYPVMYSCVFSGVFDNVKPVNELRMCSFNVEASLCLGDANVVVSIYILVVFLDRRSFALLCFSSSAFLPFCADE
jgi:hypothetical protein